MSEQEGDQAGGIQRSAWPRGIQESREMAYKTHTSTLSGVKKSNTKIPMIGDGETVFSEERFVENRKLNRIPPRRDGHATALLVPTVLCLPNFGQLPVEGFPIDARTCAA